MMIQQNQLSVKDYQRLIKEAGWEEQSIEAVTKALHQSIVTFNKVIDGQVVGMVRLVGDGKIVFYIQDLVVSQTHRQQGIATELMNSVVDYLDQHAAVNSFVGLMSAAKLEGFYKKFGFMARPTDGYGAGMTQIWKPSNI